MFYDHLLNLISNAEKEVIVATSSDGLSRKLEYMKSTFRKLKQSKVKIKIAAPLNTSKAKEAAKELSEFADVRDVDAKSRFVIVDGKELVFMVSDDKKTHESTEVSIWVNTPFFASALSNMFDSIWRK